MHNSRNNPIRRNRNIGTSKAGHGQNNRLVIPASWTDNRLFYEKLVNPIKVCVNINSIALNIFVEPTRSRFVHSCTIDDILYLLKLIPVSHLKGIKSIILRQPKRKEIIISPVWGRLVYWSSISHYSGAAICLEAININRVLKWSKSLTPEYLKELERLRNDGHIIKRDRRNYLITPTIDSIRNTQLYRTLPHEIGHYVDYLQSVENSSKNDRNKWDILNNLYHKKPQQDKEAFAHSYADQFYTENLNAGNLPFKRICDRDNLISMNLELEWFGI